MICIGQTGNGRTPLSAPAAALQAAWIVVLFLSGTGHEAPAAAQERPQAEALGGASFVVEPPDARIEVGDRVPRAPGRIALPASDYVAEITRPGYVPTLVGFTVADGEEVDVAVAMERASATLRLRTAPSEATVLVEGFVRGRTEGKARPGFTPEGPAAFTPGTSFSAELWLADLPVGSHRLEIRREGFRTFSQTLDIPALLDYELPPVVLEQEHAMLLLEGLPKDAKVYGNGREMQPDRSKLKPEVAVLPGQLDLVVTRGRQDVFETSVVVEDGAWLEVGVEMKPALAFLGTFGEDAAGRRAVASAIEFLQRDGVHIVLDRSELGHAVFAERGIDSGVLRDWTAAKSELAWDAIQAQFQRETPAALYFVAVLSDDLAADSVDLWWWSSSPGPARPDVLSIDLRSGKFEGSALRRLARSLDPAVEVGIRTPDLGVGLIESLKSDGLVVATVDPGGPAAAAGLLPGIEVRGIDGELASADQLTTALNRLQPGGGIEFAVGGEKEEATTMVIHPEWGWTQLDVLAPDLSLAAAAARLIRKFDRATDTPRWLLELDLAALALAAGDPESAIQLLEAIEAPDRGGLGAETVQYTFGVALSDLADRGQDQERQRARSVFESLALTEHGRLYADEGPKVAPRARLRADALAER
ncbi:MAG: hypothetical protein OXG74_12700 [Acidobacteria bacterium]|nr:hypothetical protein [Acidobacteriota bacterium]